MADADAVPDGALPVPLRRPLRAPTASAPGPRGARARAAARCRSSTTSPSSATGSSRSSSPSPSAASSGFYFWDEHPEHPARPAARPASSRSSGPGDAFVIKLRISIVVGIILAMPVILWQVWAFVAPGLTASEQRTVRPWIPLALLFFALGVAIAYVILPFAVGFLLGFTDDRLVAQPHRRPVLRLRDHDVPRLRPDHGVPDRPVRAVAGRDRDLAAARLEARRIAILGIAIFAAAITPGGDLVSPFALGGTMYLLFEGTIFFIRRSGK